MNPAQPFALQKYRAYLAILTANVIWAAAIPIIKVTINQVPVFTFLLYRFLIVGIILLPILYIELKKHPINILDLPSLIFLGLLGQSSIVFIFAGISFSSTIDVAIISAVSPIFTVILGKYFYKETLNIYQKIGIFLAIAGTMLVVVEPLINTELKLIDSSLTVYHRIFGNLLVIIYNICFACYIVFSKYIMGDNSKTITKTFKLFKLQPLKHSYSPFLQTAFTFYVALFTFIPLATLEFLGVFGQYNFKANYLDLYAFLGIIYMAIFSSILAYTIFEWGVKKVKATDAAVFSYLNPLLTMPFSYLILSEIPTTSALIGGGILITGIVIAEQIKS